MISNYYILHSVVREIRERLIGAKFLRAFSFRAGELRMEFDSGDTLIAQLQPAHTTLYLSRSAEREPKKNVMSFFKELEGSAVSEIVVADNDKFVTIKLGEYDLILRFYNSPNALLYKNSVFSAAYKREPVYKEKIISPISPITPIPTRDTLRQKLPMLGKWLEAELLAEINKKGGSVDLDAECSTFDQSLRESKSGFIYQHKGLLLSPIVLQILDSEYKKYNSISDAIEHVIRLRSKTSTFKSKKDALLAKLHGALTRTLKALKDAESGVENSERSERYAAIGDAIQTKAHEIEKGIQSIVLIIFDKETKVSLDPALSAFDNAKRYYDKSKRGREMQKELQARFISLKKEGDTLSAFIERVEHESDLKLLDTLEKETAAEGFALSRTKDDLGDDSDPIARFRKYIVFGGYRVLVGKNAKQNDELTLHVAKKEDIWFHARHVPGSHVVLQINNVKQIPKEAIEQAAEIAAFYSDAKTQKHAPVAYTKKKYVRKPRGAAPGAVKVEKEEVVIVTPRIPE